MRTGLTRSVALSLALALGPVGSVAAGAQNAHPCGSERAHALDFWLGEWRVESAEGVHQGDNTISAALGGCAIIEDWRSAGGGEGMSLFAFDARKNKWQQLWVTADTSRAGGLKNKFEFEAPEGSARFQGEYMLDDGRHVRDRTTLTPLEDGRVRQLIEVSIDGADWIATFDAFYARK